MTTFLLSILGTLVIVSIPFPVLADETKIEFNRDVRPILADKCLACHGADVKKREADLRLDDPESAMRDRDDGRAIEAGKPDESLVWQRIISQDESLIMPPAGSPKTLTDREKKVLREWIEQGAPFEKHWAFESPKLVPIPKAEHPQWIRNPIDHFIQERLHSLGLVPAKEADRPTLIRRVALALTGLPPTLEEQSKYFVDTSDAAYENMVDRYLASERFGEEMARHWLDVARYADTHGMHLDNERQTWAYRDWVIQAFNRNVPFDEFTVQQLAGDLLPEPSPEQMIATGFNRCNVTSSEGGSIDAELLYRYAVDRASTTMETWMGLTGGCATCHDHKFDPISQKEFYSFYAFFNSAADPAMDGNALLTQPIMKLESPEVRSKRQTMEAQLQEVESRLTALAGQLEYQEPASIEEELTEVIWMEDAFPEGKLTAMGAPLQWVESTDARPTHQGKKALLRTEAGLGQDVWENGLSPLQIPTDGRFRAWVYLDPANPPKAIMLQFHKLGWQHRAVWGDYDIIPWGAINTTEKVHQGSLPEPGKWSLLEVPCEQVGLQAGELLTGFALTQHGGTVLWDSVGVYGKRDLPKDPLMSFQAWLAFAQGRDLNEVPEPLRGPIKSGGLTQTQKTAALHFYLESVHVPTRPRFAALRQEQSQLRQSMKQLDESIPGTFIYRDLEKPRPSFVMMRGAYDKPADPVEPSVPAIFPPMQRADMDRPATRLDLAKWLISAEHPLTARVTVNRLWQQMFGTGLVKTSYDFGTQGEMPSHPLLLDWLARQYQQQGWNTKSMVRLMVTSHTFRQDSSYRPGSRDSDPENRWLARGPRFRLDAEPIRDNALFVSGLIDLTMGGKGVRTYQPPNIWEPVGFAGSNTRFYTQDSGSALYRRSIYTFYKRTAPPPFMSNFDAPNREQFCSRRERSNTPLQALQLMNDIQHVEAARALAQRLMAHGGNSLESRLDYGYRLVLSRSLQPIELPIWERQLQKHLARFKSDQDAAKNLIQVGESRAESGLDPTELASYTLLCNTLLNLDETLCRN